MTIEVGVIFKNGQAYNIYRTYKKEIYMFNIAVVNIKDILKYLVSITITFFLVMLVTRFFSGLNENEKNKLSQIMKTSLLICLDEVIPGIKETNHELNNNDESLINENNILGELLKIELAMFTQEEKNVEIHNLTANKVDELEVDVQDEESKKEIEEVRKSNNTNSNCKPNIR